VYCVGIRLKSEGRRLGHVSGDDAVKEYWLVIIVEQNVDAEEVTAAGGEVVVDRKTRLSVERLRCRCLH